MVAEELESILMQSSVGFVVMRGPEHVFELLNPPYLEMAGRTEAQLLGKRYRDAFPELAGTGTYEMLDQTFTTGEAFSASEYKVPLRRGGVVQQCVFNFRVQAFRDAEARSISGLLGVVVEVTELVERRKEAEAMAERLRISEERFRGAQETSLDAFVALAAQRDAAGKIVDFRFQYQNGAAQKINGFDPATVAGKSLLENFPSIQQTELWAAYHRCMETGAPFRLELFYAGDRLDTWLRVMACKVGDGLAISFSDVSAQKRAEAAERDAREKAEFLATEIAEQCREMEQALEQLRTERDQALAEVAKHNRSAG